MKCLTLILILLTSTTFARTRSFFKTEEAYAMKAIYNGTFEISGRSAAVISEHSRAKLVVFKTNGHISGPVSAKGLQSIMVHAIADNFAYALFYDAKGALPGPVSNGLYSLLEQSDVRSMKFGKLRGGEKYNTLSRNIAKNTELALLIFDDGKKSKLKDVSIKSCSSKLNSKRVGSNYRHFQFKQEKSCPLEYLAPKKTSIHYFMVSNNLHPVVMGLIIETRQIILNLGNRLKRESKKKMPSKTKVATLQKKIKKEKRELRLLKQFLERINE